MQVSGLAVDGGAIAAADPLAAIRGAFRSGEYAEVLRLIDEAGPDHALVPPVFVMGARAAFELDLHAEVTPLLRRASHGPRLSPGVIPHVLQLSVRMSDTGHDALLATIGANIPALAPLLEDTAAAVATLRQGDPSVLLDRCATLSVPARRQALLELGCRLMAGAGLADHALLLLARLESPAAPLLRACVQAALRTDRLEAALGLLKRLGPDEVPRAMMVRLVGRALALDRADLATQVLELLAEPPADLVSRVAVGWARAGDEHQARRVMRRFAPAEKRLLALGRAKLLWGLGRLEEARSRLEELLQRWPHDPDLLEAAIAWADEADDGPAAARYVAAFLPDDLAPSPSMALHLARCADEGGAEAAAWALLRMARAGVAEDVDAPEGGQRSNPMVSLRLYDMASARHLAARLEEDNTRRQLAEACFALLETDPVLAEFTRRAAAAYAVEQPVRQPGAELAILARAALFPSATLDPETEEIVWEGENPAVRHALALTLAKAEAAGLRCQVLPALSNMTPSWALGYPAGFVAFHTVAEAGLGIHLKLGPLPDALLMDGVGYSGWASAAQQPLDALPLDGVDAGVARAWLQAERARVSALNRSKYAQAARQDISFDGKPVVLVALQLPSDTVLRHAWMNMFDMARGVVRAFAGLDGLVLIKRHPKCRDPRTDAFLREVAAEPHVRIVTASLHDLLPHARAVFVVNSGVGAEALLHGRTVYIAGAVDYRHACHEVRSAADIPQGFGAIQPRHDADMAARYLYWYRNHYHVPLDQPGALEAAIDQRIVQPALRRRDAARAIAANR